MNFSLQTQSLSFIIHSISIKLIALMVQNIFTCKHTQSFQMTRSIQSLSKAFNINPLGVPRVGLLSQSYDQILDLIFLLVQTWIYYILVCITISVIPKQICSVIQTKVHIENSYI